nr:PEP-utilizing enzyme [Rhodococcus wratislaviensis]GLK40863.1 hypothetical protein GCM10017611_77380 [Rhodococcus wratislaviensis]
MTTDDSTSNSDIRQIARDAVGHAADSTNAMWTTVNAEEVLTGTMTPATWSFHLGSEQGFRAGYVALGMLPRRELTSPKDADQKFLSSMYRKSVLNIDRMRDMADATPGSSGKALEEAMFGRVRPGIGGPRRSRYPIVAVKAPLAIRRARRDLRSMAAGLRGSRKQAIRDLSIPAPSATLAKTLLAAARDAYDDVIPLHFLVTVALQGEYAKIVAMAASSRVPELTMSLVQSPGGVDELRMLRDLWEVSRDRLTLEQFLDEHGYHGPNEANVEANVWREDPTPVRHLVDRYRGLADDAGPEAIFDKRTHEQAVAVEQLLAPMNRRQRAKARRVLASAGELVELRELGKSLFLQCIDAGRAAVKTLGRQLAADGLIDSETDVVYLTVDELLAEAKNFTDLVSQRKIEQELFARIDIPTYFEGVPAPAIRPSVPTQSRTSPGDSPDTVTGQGVSPGIAEGRPRIATDPGDLDFDDGDILVCRTTDPSWASLIMVAGALVVDVGGAMSHAAIVARELGIPCVINTAIGTRDLSGLTRVRVDGTSGEVAVLDR